jgi:hypothetical protein
VGSFRLFTLRLAWLVFGWESVVLIDHDQEMNARLVRGEGQAKFAKRWSYTDVKVRLLPSGSVAGPCYVKQWTALFPPQK